MAVAQITYNPESDNWSLFISRNNHHKQIGNHRHQQDMYDIKAVEINLYQNAKDCHVKMPYDCSMKNVMDKPAIGVLQ